MAKEKDNKKAKPDAKADAKTNGKATDKNAKAGNNAETKADACYKSLKNYVPKKKQGYLKAALNHATDKNLEAIKKMPKKSPGTTGFLAILTGWLGLDRFYLGDILRGITKIIATAIIALTICARFLPYFKDEVPNKAAVAPQPPETAQEGLNLEDGYSTFIGVWTNQTGDTTLHISKTGMFAVPNKTSEGEGEEGAESKKTAFTVTTAEEDNIKCLYIVPAGLSDAEAAFARMKLTIVSGNIKTEYAPDISEIIPDLGGGGGGGEGVSHVVPLEGEEEEPSEEPAETPKEDPNIFEKQFDEQGKPTVYRAGIPEFIATIILVAVAVIFGLYLILDIFLSPKKARKDNYYRVLEIINPAPKEEK